MKTYYAWLLSHLYVMAECGGLEEQMSEYTDNFIFIGVAPYLKERDRNDVLSRVFGFWIGR